MDYLAGCGGESFEGGVADVLAFGLGHRGEEREQDHPAHRFPAQEPTQPYPPDFRRLLRRPRIRAWGGRAAPHRSTGSAWGVTASRSCGRQCCPVQCAMRCCPAGAAAVLGRPTAARTIGVQRSAAPLTGPWTGGARPSLRTIAGRPEQLLRRAADRPAGTDHPTGQLRTGGEYDGRRDRRYRLGQ